MQQLIAKTDVNLEEIMMSLQREALGVGLLCKGLEESEVITLKKACLVANHVLGLKGVVGYFSIDEFVVLSDFETVVACLEKVGLDREGAKNLRTHVSPGKNELLAAKIRDLSLQNRATHLVIPPKHQVF